MAKKTYEDKVRPGWKDRLPDEDETVLYEEPERVPDGRDKFVDRTPAEIAEECAKIRATWTETERRSRAMDPALKVDQNNWEVPEYDLKALDLDFDVFMEEPPF